MTYQASVVITSCNRRELLRQAIKAVETQNIPLEVIVMDDASTDGTAEMMRAEFPHVAFVRSEVSRGPSYQRTEGVRRAQSELVVLIDDDSLLQAPDTVEHALKEFEADPRIAVVAMPFANILQSPKVLSRAPDGAQGIHLCHAFVACAHAVRRSVFLEVGGYREVLFYMGEEGDLSLRLLEAGHLVRLGSGPPLHHHKQPGRLSRRADTYGRRNDILLAWLNAPLPLVPLVWASSTVRGLMLGARRGWQSFRHMVVGLAWGYASVLRHFGSRRAVRSEVFRLHRYLKLNEPVPLDSVEGRAGMPPRGR